MKITYQKYLHITISHLHTHLCYLHLRIPPLGPISCTINLALNPSNTTACVQVRATRALDINILNVDIRAYGGTRADEVANQRIVLLACCAGKVLDRYV